jgi:NitT/TauT family transport system permease protein
MIWARSVIWGIGTVLATLMLVGFIEPRAWGLLVDGRFWAIVAVWALGWLVNAWLADKGARLIVALVFGTSLLVLWQMIVQLYAVSPVILPGPLAIAARFGSSLDVLWGDFVQTFVKGALSGYIIGCGAAFLMAVAVDKSLFLQRGLLPVGNFVAALPVVGIAPILVMWFGFDWQSKAAVVVVMVFFPVLVNVVAGLKAADPMQRDLMATYGAGYWQSLLKLRLPAAMPFIFNGLKIATTLAMIGAIVAEFFGSPTQGMGFRISTEVGRLGLDMVWAQIAVAAMAGSAFYAGVAMIEKGVTFWHPSQRGR